MAAIRGEAHGSRVVLTLVVTVLFLLSLAAYLLLFCVCANFVVGALNTRISLNSVK